MIEIEESEKEISKGTEFIGLVTLLKNKAVGASLISKMTEIQ